MSRVLLYLTFGLVVSGCGTLRREITSDELQAHLEKHFPVARQEALWTVRLSDPRVSLAPGASQARIELAFDIDGPGVHEQGRGRMQATPAYRVDEAALYLADLRLDSLEIAGREHRHLKIAVEAAARDALGKHPVYRLSPTGSARERRARKHLRRVLVEDGKIVVEYAL